MRPAAHTPKLPPDRELPRSLRKPPEELAQTPPSVPRPVAILNTENEMRALTAAEMQRLGIRPHEGERHLCGRIAPLDRMRSMPVHVSPVDKGAKRL